MKHTLAALTCTLGLVASVAACGGGGDKASLPIYTRASSPSTTATSGATPTTPPPTATGPVALAASSTYTYGGLKVVVNLPTDVPSASRPSLRFFSEFLQAVGRTKASNKVDPSVSGLASARVVEYLQSTTGGESVQGIGTVTYTISQIHAGTSGVALVTGCLDQSKLVQVRKDGSHFVDAAGKKYPTLKLRADINPGEKGPEVSAYSFAVGSC